MPKKNETSAVKPQVIIEPKLCYSIRADERDPYKLTNVSCTGCRIKMIFATSHNFIKQSCQICTGFLLSFKHFHEQMSSTNNKGAVV